MAVIAFLCTSGLNNALPSGRLLPLARELVKRGHELHLLMLHPTFDQLLPHDKAKIIDGVHLRHVGQMHVYGLPGQRRYYNPAELAVVSLKAAWALASAALAVKPDIIHICKPQPINGLGGFIAARRLRCRLCVDCDDYEAEANRFGSGLGGRIQKSLVTWWEDTLPRRADAVTVNTHFLQQRNIQLGVDPKRVFYVPNGVGVGVGVGKHDTSGIGQDHVALNTQPSTLIYVGTMSKIAHGVDVLIEAMPHVLARIPAATLLMVGDGDDRPALIQQAAQLGLGDAIHWVGPVPADQVPAYWRQARCSVDPVYDSPGARGRSPLKIVESLAAGVPVVTGDVGDRREMVGRAGRMVQPGNAAALAEGICDLLSGPPIDPAIIQLQAQRYAWATLADDWLRSYTTLQDTATA